MSLKTKYRTPKNLSISSSREFLTEIEPIFSLAGKRINGVLLDTSQTEKVDLFGQLLLYKFIEYTIHRSCFNAPKTNLKENGHLKNGLDKTGFLPFVNEFMNKKNNQLKSDIPDDYDLRWNEDGALYIAPIVLSKSNDYEEREEIIYQKIKDYYGGDSTIVGTIMSCISEVGSNFLEHSEETTNSVLVASGNRDYFELACADTGMGTISSLRGFFPGRLQIHEVLRKALDKGVTSKPGTNHTGSGLWLISQYVSFTGGDFFIFSEGAYCHQKKSIYKLGQCGKWKGTIVYLRLPLFHKEVLAERKKELSSRFNRIQLSLI